MAKSRTKVSSQEGSFASGRSASQGKLTPSWGPLSPRARLLEVVLHKGFEGVMRMLEEDREALCGPKGRWQPARQSYRYGFDEGRLVYGGRTVRLQKPRVRKVGGGEVELPSWRWFSDEDPLQDRAVRQILAGVATRKYAESLEEVPEGLQPAGTSRSSVSRRFLAVTMERMREFLSRPLDGLDIPVILIDGTGFQDHLMVTALGIDSSGAKHVLGTVEGTTESEEVCRALLRDLIERGLKVEQARLFVIDGGKGLRKAIRGTFAGWALVHRCHVHKLRNVAEHLPKHKRAWVRAAIRKAWSAETATKAKSKLEDLAHQLQSDHPGAAASIREGLDETLTLIRLGVDGALYRTLCSTNPIENLFERVKCVTRNVKRWRNGSMVQRWVVTGLMAAEQKFRRVRGHRDLHQLVAALDALIGLDKKEQVA